MTPNQLAVIAEVLRQIGPQKDAPRTERNRPGKPKHTPIEVPPPPDAMVQELADLIGEFGRHVPESLADVKTEDLDFYDIALAYGMKFRRSVIAGSRLWDAEWARAFHWFASKVKSVLENVRYQLGAEIADFQQHIIAPRLREAAMELNEDAVDLAAQFMMIALNGWDPARGNLRSYVRAWLLGGLVNFQNEAFAQSPYYRLLVQREQLLHADTAFHLCPKCRRTANYPHATECAQCHCAGEHLEITAFPRFGVPGVTFAGNQFRRVDGEIREAIGNSDEPGKTRSVPVYVLRHEVENPTGQRGEWKCVAGKWKGRKVSGRDSDLMVFCKPLLVEPDQFTNLQEL